MFSGVDENKFKTLILNFLYITDKMIRKITCIKDVEKTFPISFYIHSTNENCIDFEFQIHFVIEICNKKLFLIEIRETKINNTLKPLKCIFFFAHKTTRKLNKTHSLAFHKQH